MPMPVCQSPRGVTAKAEQLRRRRASAVPALRTVLVRMVAELYGERRLKLWLSISDCRAERLCRLETSPELPAEQPRCEQTVAVYIWCDTEAPSLSRQ